jgi:hypothetical protein
MIRSQRKPRVRRISPELFAKWVRQPSPVSDRLRPRTLEHMRERTCTFRHARATRKLGGRTDARPQSCAPVRPEIQGSPSAKVDAPTRAPKIARRCVLYPRRGARVSVEGAEVQPHHLGARFGDEPRGRRAHHASSRRAGPSCSGARRRGSIVVGLVRATIATCIAPLACIAGIPTIADIGARVGASVVPVACDGRWSVDVTVEVATATGTHPVGTMTCTQRAPPNIVFIFTWILRRRQAKKVGCAYKMFNEHAWGRADFAIASSPSRRRWGSPRARAISEARRRRVGSAA